MKFMLFAATALAVSTPLKRQLSVVEDALQKISDGTSSLRDGINSFSGIADAGSLEDTASGLVDIINQANTDVGAIEPLDSSAASLATPLQSLAALVSGTVDDLVAKKQTFVDAGVAGVVLDQATALQSAAQTFTQTTLGKVPDDLQGLGQQLAQPIADALSRAVQEFTGLGNGGSGSSSGGSGASTTTGGGSASSTGGSGSGSYSTPAATTTGGGSYSTPSASATSSSNVGSYTGAAIANAVNGYGAVAMAVLAGAAML